MNKNIEDFISARIDLIDTNQWEEIYKDAQLMLMGEDIGAFTTYLIVAGIDPLEYLDDIPDNYLYYSSLVNPKIINHPDTVGHAAFSNSSIQNINIPNSVIDVFSYAFANCQDLETVHLGDNIRAIDSNAFFKCEKLKEINFPNSLTTIGKGAFKWCESLPEVIELNEGLETIREEAFSLSKPRTYIIPKSVRRIHQDAFLPKVGTKLIIDKENTYAQEWAQINDYEYEVR